MARNESMLRSTASASEDSPEGELTLRSVFDRQEQRLLRYAFSMTRRRAIAEEIVQDVFLQLHQHWSEIDSPEAWLVRCTRNRCLDYLRRSQREVLQEHPETENPMSESWNTTSVTLPDTRLIRGEAIAALKDSIRQLPELDRKLIELKYFEGLKYREISERTGLTVTNVGFRLHRLLKDMASQLPGLGVEDLS